MANRTISRYPTGFETYRIIFEYLSRQFVVVTLVNTADESLNRVLKPVDDYVFDSPTIIRLKAPQTGFDAVQIHRFTTVVPLVDFRDGSVLTASDLTVAELQAIHIAEEGRDQTIDLAKEYTDIAVDSGNKAQNILDQILALGSDSTDRVWAENRYQLKDYTPIETGSLSEGGILTSASSAIKDTTSGLHWAYVGTFPHTVAAGTDPSTDPNFHCVGRLGQLWEFNDSRNWYTPSATVDNTVPLGLFLKAMQRHSLTANIVGPVITSKRITCDCDIDMTACEWHVPSNHDSTLPLSMGSIPLVILDPQTEVTTGNSFTTSNIGQVAHIQLSNAKFSNKTVGVEGEGEANIAYDRGIGINSKLQKTDLFVMDGGTTGNHPDTPALYKYTGTAKFTVRPLRPRRTIKCGVFVLDGAPDGGRVVRSFISVERNNTHILGGYASGNIAGGKTESFVKFEHVTGCSVLDVSMPNNMTSQSNYTVLCFNTNRITVENVHAPTGWAVVDGNFMRNTFVSNCSGATIGCHAMAWNFTVRDCKLTPVDVGAGRQGGVGLTGGGTLLVENLEYTYLGGPRRLDHPVSTRGDFGQAWEGDIIVRNVILNYGAAAPSGEGCTIVYMTGAAYDSVDRTRDCYMGKRIIISGVTVKVANGGWTADQVNITPVWYQTTYTQKVRYPTVVTLEDFRVETTGPGFTFDARITASLTDDNIVKSVCDYTLRRVQLPRSSFLAWDTAPGPFKVTNRVLLEDIVDRVNIVKLAMPTLDDTFTVRNSLIERMDVGNANSAGTVYVENCRIMNGAVMGSDSGGTDRVFYKGNHALGRVILGARAVYCSGNTVATGGSGSGRTVAEWWSYRDPTVFRTS